MIAIYFIPVLFFLGAVAWFFGTLVAGGAASLLLPLLVLMFGSATAAPAITFAALITNPTRAFTFARYIDWKVVGWLMPGTIVGAVLGAYSFSRLNADVIKLVMGIFLLSTVFQEKLENSGFKLLTRVGWFLPLGFVVAFISGLVGAVGPVYNPFFMSYGLYKEDLVATKAINSLILQTIKLFAYGSFGAFTSDILLIGLTLGIGGAVGVVLAKNYLLKMDAALFKKIMYIFMPLLGTLLIFQSTSAMLAP